MKQKEKLIELSWGGKSSYVWEIIVEHMLRQNNSSFYISFFHYHFEFFSRLDFNFNFSSSRFPHLYCHYNTMEFLNWKNCKIDEILCRVNFWFEFYYIMGVYLVKLNIISLSEWIIVFFYDLMVFGTWYNHRLVNQLLANTVFVLHEEFCFNLCTEKINVILSNQNLFIIISSK